MVGGKHIKLKITIISLLLYVIGTGQDLQEGFEIETYLEDFIAPVGITYAENGLMYIWELNGLVWVIENGIKLETPVIDISEEVAFYGDLGLSAIALHPEFLSNGYIYLSYAVDQHYLLHYGTPEYDPDITSQYVAQTGRLTRYKVDTNDYKSIVPDSRTILLGEQINNGFPIMAPSHGTGDLVFGEDNTLLISAGEGTTWVNYHTGGEPFPEFAFEEEGLQFGMINSMEDVGSYRSQLLQSIGGKVLRIDPITGGGLPSNPFYDPDSPDDHISKVWALGLRNPFRMTLKPNSGNPNPELANPGSLYIGDVGYNRWEELNVCNSPGQNFGWPRYEGQSFQPGYGPKPTYDLYSPNPLFNGTTCEVEYFRFRDFIKDPLEDHSTFFGNPCDSWVEISEHPTFVHERPKICWRNFAHFEEVLTYVPGFGPGGYALPIPLTESQVEGEEFEGIASTGGAFYYGTSFPEEFFGAYFHMDFSGWIKTFWFDENDQLSKVDPFLSNLENLVHLSFNPFDECLYLVQVFPGTVYRICYGENIRPIAIIDADTLYGPSPLTVQFDGSNSFDPDGDPITYEWDFGDNTTSAEISPTHIFSSPGTDPFSFEVSLTVRDTADNESVETIIISLNNTPPVVNITGFEDGSLYPLQEPTLLNLEAEVIDLEHALDELNYEWQVFFHHNTHFHTEPIITDPVSSFLIDPIQCSDLDSYYYRVHLKVTDDAGLWGEDVHSVYPNCSDTIPSLPIEGYTLYPNPSDHFVQIKGEFEEDIYSTSIFDLTGRLVQSSSIAPIDNTRLPIEVFALKSGTYVLRIESTNLSTSFRFVKQ